MFYVFCTSVPGNADYPLKASYVLVHFLPYPTHILTPEYRSPPLPLQSVDPFPFSSQHPTMNLSTGVLIFKNKQIITSLNSVTIAVSVHTLACYVLALY